MAGTLGSTTNCSLQKLWRARVGDFRFFRTVQRRAVERRRAMEVVYPCCCGLDVQKKSITARSEEHTSELQSLAYLVCRLLLEKKILDIVNLFPRGRSLAHAFMNLQTKE